MKQHTRKQHYVPKVLLRNFIMGRKGILYRLDKRDNHVIKTGINDLFEERDFYTIDNDAAVEDHFGKTIENDVQSVFEQILHTVSLQALSSAAMRTLLKFLVLQDMRSKRVRKIITKLDSILNTHIHSIREETGLWPVDVCSSPLTGQVLTANEAKRTQARLIFENTDSSIEVLLRGKSMYLLYAESKTDFYCLGDTPFVMHQCTPPKYAYGYAQPLMCIYMPISPKITLSLMDNEYPIAKMHPNHSTLLQTHEKVVFVNNLQAMWADKYLVSNTGDFSSITCFLSSHPQYRFIQESTILKV